MISPNEGRKSKAIRIFSALIFAVITTLALGANYSIASWDTAAKAIGSQNSLLVSLVKLRQNFNLYTLPWQVCAVIFWVIYYKLGETWTFSTLEVVAALLFGVINVISNSLVVNGNWGFVFANTYQTVVSSVCIIGQAALLLSIIKVFFSVLDGIPRGGIQQGQQRGLSKLLKKYPWCFSFCCLLLCWLPDLIVGYPAHLTSDGVNQLQQWIQAIPRTNAHPFLGTLIYGILFDIGKVFGNDNFAIFFVVMGQSCIMAASYATVIQKMQRMGLSPFLSGVALVFYGLHPMMGEYAHTIIKDGISSAVFALFMVEIASFALDMEHYTKSRRNLLQLTLWGVLSCLLRHNYSYAVFSAFLVAFCFSMRKSKRMIKFIAVCMVACTICVQGINAVGPHLFKYAESNGGMSALMVIPAQQTARYVRDHTDEITADEKAVIDSVFDYNSLGDKYNPNTADPVGGTYRRNTVNTESIKQYLAVWANMLFKHPETYLQATIHGSHAYYAFTSYSGVRTMANILYRDSIYRYNVEFLGMDVSYLEEREPVLMAWENARELVIRFPIWGLLCNCAFYTWLFLLVGLYFSKKREWRIWILLVPVIFIFLTCVASPVNGNWRYYLPAVVSTPVIIAAGIQLLKTGQREDNSQT